MRKTKKILAAVLALVLMFALASCGSVGPKVYLAQKLQSDQGNATFKYDKKNQVLNVEATNVASTEDDGSSDFDVSTELVNLKNFSNNQERNYYLITSDNFIFNPLIKNGRIKKMVVTYPDNNRLSTTSYLFKTNDKGQVISVSEGSDKYSYTYDKAGHLTAKTAYSNGSKYYTTTFKYNKAGEITSMAYQYSEAVLQQYQTALAQYGSSTDLSSLGNAAVAITYDKLGRVASISNKESGKSIYTYNNSDQLISIKSNTPSTKATTTFKYDSKGNLEVISTSSTSTAQDYETTYTMSKFKSIS